MLEEGNHKYNTTVVSLDLSSIGFLLFIIFLSLKLTNIIDWSWFYVTMPLWIPFALVVAIWILLAIFALIVAIITSIMDACGKNGTEVFNKVFKNKKKK